MKAKCGIWRENASQRKEKLLETNKKKTKEVKITQEVEAKCDRAFEVQLETTAKFQARERQDQINKITDICMATGG